MRKPVCPDWEAVGRDYMGEELSVRAIAAKYGISTQRLLNYRDRAGWPARAERYGMAGTRGPVRAAKEPPGKVALAGRLMKTVERKLKQMEIRMTKGDGSDASPAESERDARALANLTRTLDRASEMIAGERGSEGAAAAGLETAIDDKAGDALRLRRELAERIERLAKRGEA